MPPVDAIVVLGCKVRPDGGPSAMLAARVETGVQLLLRGHAPRLLMSGGTRTGTRPESHVMRQYALELGAPERALWTEPWSLSTEQNAHHCRSLLGPDRRVLVVTQAFHAPRALRLFREAGLDAGWAPAPEPPLRPRTRARLWLAEWVAARW